MKKGFSIQDYLEKNKIELGSIKKEVGSSVYKGGHNDLRKTSYDVNIKDGKFQLDTHKTVLTENKKGLNESTEKYTKINKQKLSKLVNDELNKGHLSIYDNGKITITIEKYDKVNFDLVIKEEY